MIAANHRQRARSPHGLLFDADPLHTGMAHARESEARFKTRMREQLEALRAGTMARLSDDAGTEEIEAVRVRVLGRGGELTEVMRRMREVPAEERPAIGQLVNQIKRELEERIEQLQQRQREAELA